MQNLKEKGNRLGAKPKLTQTQWDKIEQLLSDTPATAKEVAAKFKVSVALIHKRFPGGKIALQRAAFRRKRKK
jgi:DNA invertase Pin-like site-specific DNA recombinase